MPLHICITGANRGIGLSLTQNYLNAGHQVWAVARHPDESPELAAVARESGSRLHLVQADISREDDVSRLAAAVGAQSLDILINNAGVMLDPPTAFVDIPMDIFHKSFATNVFGTIQVTQKLLPALQRSSKPVLAFMSSQMGSLSDNSSGGHYAYRSSKAALNMILRSLAHDHPWLKAVTLHPGWVQTRMGGKHAPTTLEQSTAGLQQVLANLTAEQSGSFLDFRGRVLPW